MWQPYLQDREVGIICLQWWLGEGDRTADYLAPREIYRELDLALQRHKVSAQSVVLQPQEHKSHEPISTDSKTAERTTETPIMSNFFKAFFVKTSQPMAEFKERFSDAVLVPDSEWIACDYGDDLDDGVFEPGRFLTQELSSQWGEVIFFCVDERDDQFEYEHSQDGAILRQLCWSSDGSKCTWTAIEGQPEPWEAEAVFSAESFAKAQEIIRYDAHGAYLPEEQRRAKELQVRDLWERREYVLNDQWPWADAFTAFAILRSLSLKLPPFE